MNLLRFLILAAGSLTLKDQANVRQEDLRSSSARRELPLPAVNVTQAASHQVIVTQAALLRQASAVPAVLLLAVNVKLATSPQVVIATLAVSPEVSVRQAAPLQEDARREAPAPEL